MTDRLLIKLLEPSQAHQALMTQVWPLIKASLIAGHRLALEVRGETRSTAQNRIMQARLTDISNQVEWVVDGQLCKMSKDEWKDVISAGLTKSQRVAKGIDGGFVILGRRTSKMTVKEMTEMIELCGYFGDQHGVRWSRTSLGRDWPDEE